MPTLTTTNVLDALVKYQVLTAPQLEEVKATLQQRLNTPQALLQELVRRGWLTLYQGKQILNGRAAELMLGRYLLLDQLGQGGVGQVFKAKHVKMQRIVALKILRQEQNKDNEAVQRFFREIEVISQLSHPNIVHAYEAGPIGNLLVLVLEHVDGPDLERLVQKSGPLPVAQACEYIRQAAIGLQYAHERGLVHRDIKPSNLLVTQPQGTKSGGLVKLLDLGLARLQQPAKDSKTANLTVLGSNQTMQGTPDYMAPEQGIDFHKADTRSDIYSLGCTLYFLLKGQPPFAGANLAEKLVKHHQVEPDIVGIREDLPNELVPVLHKLLAKRPDDRYQTPGEVAAALDPFCPATPTMSATGTTTTVEIPKRTTKFSSLFGFKRTLLEKVLRTDEPTEVAVGDQPASDQPAPTGRKRLLLVGSAVAGLLLVVGLGLFLLGGNGSSSGGGTAGAGLGTLTVRLVVDDQYELYVNGVHIGGGTGWEKIQEHSAPLQAGTNVVAVKGFNKGGAAGLLAEVSVNGKRFVSGVPWKVSPTAPPEWANVAFDDRSWGKSTDQGAYGSGGWETRVTGLAKDSSARWIWTNKTTSDQTLYFRWTFATDSPKVASYRDDFASPKPISGWKYLWNKSGPIGSPANYEPLLWDTGKMYNSHGQPKMPGPAPGSWVNLSREGGCTGQGSTQTPSKLDHYVIAAYTIQEIDGPGPYRIADSSFAKGNVTKLLVHVNNNLPVLTRPVPANPNPPINFNTDLGTLKPGDTIYVAIGPEGSDGNDHFNFDFSIVRGGKE